MLLRDIPGVIAIERVSFDANWPATAFEHELGQNRMARYIVLEADNKIVGFAGLWLMVDEAHIVTVGVLPELRRHGYGRALVHGLVTLATNAGMETATLECRVSNHAARALYGLYGFYEVGERRKYYADNGEDAVIMTTEALDSEPYRARLSRLQNALHRRLPGLINDLLS
jgi:ribosomal-protein-alanine N-acetyltransferase